MTTQIRHRIAQVLDSTTLAFDLPARCEHYGLEPRKETEAFADKMQYVLRRLQKLSDQEVLQVANLILADVTDDPLQSAVEQISGKQLVSDITRRRMAKALDGFSLTGTADPPHDFRMKHWPEIWMDAPKVFAIASKKYIISEEILKFLGFFDCSQIKMFGLIEDLVNPSYREEDEQKAIVEKLDPLLRLDGFTLAESGRVSGCPIYRIQQTAPTGLEPTGWIRVDRNVTEVRKRLETATMEEQFQAVGLLCRETLISLAQAVYDAQLHPTLDGVTPSDTDAKRRLEAYIASPSLSGAVRTSTSESMLGPPMTLPHICSIEERPRFDKPRLVRRQQLQL
jgi:AbiJ N-terminal domain 3